MSNALESASLIMYPSGYSNGVLGSLKPTDGSGDFTFTRGSNLSATRVGPNGYIEKGYENLLYPSNDFSVWTDNINNASVTSGQSGYDGTNDAWLLSATNNFSRIGFNISASGVQSFSVYAKASTYNFMRLRADGSATGQCFFDLENGTLGTETNTIESKIESIGNGWYRCSITLSSTTTNVKISAAQADNDLNGTDGSIYIQDAMLNQGLVAYPYIETTTAAVAGGILEDEPRIDFSDGCGHLLLEPQRTNELPNSEYFKGGILSEATLSLSGTSPENVNNAYALTETTANAEHYWESERMTTATNNNLVSTIFVKPNGRTKIRLWNYHLANQYARVDVDLTDNTTSNGAGSNVTFVFADVTDAPNGWKRVEIQSVKTSSTYAYGIRVNLLDDSGNDVYAGDVTKGVYIYGGQMEQDATYPTSYIPTYGSSQTRLRDVCEASDVASLIGQTEGTMFFDFVRGYPAAGNTDNIGLSSSGGNRIGLFFTNNSNSAVISILDSNGFRNINFGIGFVTGERYKIAVKYTNTQLKAYRNGTLFVTTDLFGFTESLNAFSLNLFNLVPQGQKYNQATLFPTALSDDECIALTSL